MNKYLLILVCCLSACGDATQDELRPPGAEGPVLIHIWDLETGQTTEVAAESLDIVGQKFNEILLHKPKMRIPVSGGHIYISTDQAFLEQGKIEQLTINDLIYLNGVVDDKPLTGTAESLELDNLKKICSLKKADFIWGNQHVTVGTLRLKSGSVIEGENWSESPVADGE